MTQVTIRNAEQEDYDSIQALYQQLLKGLAVNFPDFYKMSGADLGLKKSTFLNTIVDPNWVFLVADLGGEIIGMTQLSIDTEEDSEYRHPMRYAWIEELIVKEGQDYEAVGRALLEATETWAKGKNVDMIDLIAYIFNEKLAALCAEHGYATVSTRLRKSIKG